MNIVNNKGSRHGLLAGSFFRVLAMTWGVVHVDGATHAQECSALQNAQIYFDVYDAKTKKLIASGEESHQCKESSIAKSSKYFAPEKRDQVLQTETAVIDSNTLRVTDYNFNNLVSGESVRFSLGQNDVANVSYRPSKRSPDQEFKYRWSEKSILGKALHHFIEARWKAIVADQIPEFNLFVPSKGKDFSFRIRKSKTYKKSGQDVYVLALEPANWVMRSLVPEMDFHYSLQGARLLLLRYEGVTTIELDQEPDRRVWIDFRY